MWVELLASLMLGVGCVATGIGIGHMRTKKILADLRDLRRAMLVYDDRMNGTPPRYDDARPPEGEDYNELYSLVAHQLDRILGG